MTSSASTNLKMSSDSGCSDMCLYDMPSMVRHNLCAILDEFDVWLDLGTLHMGYSKQDLQNIRRAMRMGKSPSDELLNMWAEQDHTVTELFILLYRMQQYTAMDVIRCLVHKKYHRLISSGQPDISKLIRSENEKRHTNHKAIDNNSSKIQNISDSNNESIVTSESAHSSEDSTFNHQTINEYASTIPKIDYRELLEATMDWNDNNILGRGGFGTVYKGVWKYTEVAIKKIEYRGLGTAEAHKIQVQQSLNELRYLNSCRHDNILPLYGYSINGNEPCLVYQLMTGSLEQRLSPQRQSLLSWPQRLNIARGTARGLQYLHTFTKRPLIHGDIKPANILLDPCCQPKIGDFGLAREGPHSINSSMEVSRVYGTRPYLPLEFLGYRSLSTKVDTYSFGVVLLELATGQKAFDKNREHKFLTKHIVFMCSQNPRIENFMDKFLPVDADGIKICERLIAIGRVCISDRPEQRPEMVTVLQHLQY